MTGRGNVGVLSLRMTPLRVALLVLSLSAFAVAFARPAAADTGSGTPATASSDPAAATSSTGTADTTTTHGSVDHLDRFVRGLERSVSRFDH